MVMFFYKLLCNIVPFQWWANSNVHLQRQFNIAVNRAIRRARYSIVFNHSLFLSLTAARKEERTLKRRQRKTRLSLSLLVCQCSVSSESASRHDRYSCGLARVLVKLVGGRQTVWSLFCSLCVCVCCVRERVS